MATATLEERVRKLESALQDVQQQLSQQPAANKRGWRWFVGIDANNPHFDEAVRLGKQWRDADRPADEDKA
jgi:hypothetical protein